MGKIKKIKKNNIAEVEFDGVFCDINIELIESACIGEYVMAHAGFAIQKVDIEDYRELKNVMQI